MMRSLIVFQIMILFFNLIYCIESISDECASVIKIWKEMGGFELELNDCCEMEGVKCFEGSTVIEIDWTNKNLYGSIPADISNLKNLTELYCFKGLTVVL